MNHWPATSRSHRDAGGDIRLIERPGDDPAVRRPDIPRARDLLGWEPKMTLDEAMRKTVTWYRSILRRRSVWSDDSRA
jgi:dTDP-glucose 4,6-dehydratase